MSEFRKKIEYRFEALAQGLIKARWLVIIILLSITVLLATQVPAIKFDTSTESFLHQSDPVLQIYNNFRKQYGRDEYILIGIKPDNVFSQETLQKIKSLHEDIENEVPHLDDITSLLNARNTHGRGNVLYVEDLLEKWPENESDLENVRQRAMANPLYTDRLLSQDGTFTAIFIKTNAYSSRGAGETGGLTGTALGIGATQ